MNWFFFSNEIANVRSTGGLIQSDSHASSQGVSSNCFNDARMLHKDLK